MSIRVMDLDEAERYEPLPTQVCISITTPAAKADLRDGWLDVLRLQFHDMDVEGPSWSLMTDDQARRVVEFVRYHRHADFVVHCEAGLSRSPAVALAVHEILTGEAPPEATEKVFHLHNRYVRRKVLEAADGA